MAGENGPIRIQRQQGLYAADKSQQVQKCQDNFLVDQCYKQHIGGQPGSHEAHHLLHTVYQNRSQLFDAKIPIMRGTAPERFMITVTICAKQDNCPGQLLIGMISEYVRSKNYTDKVDMDAAFSSRPEQDGTICVTIGDEVVERTKFRNALNTLEQLQNQAAFETIKKKIDESVAKLG